MQRHSPARPALSALLAGAVGIGFAPIFVRLSEVGPSATAFYRVLFALPFLWLASCAGTIGTCEAPGAGARRRGVRGWIQAGPGPRAEGLIWGVCVAAGCLFAGDLAFWHWSIRMTSVANSTLLTNCAPFFVLLGARVLFGERITLWLVLGMCMAAAGAAMLLGASVQLTARHLTGDLLALITAAFYGGYLLAVKHLRGSLSTARVLALSGVVSCLALLGIALVSGETIRIQSGRGWAVLVGLGLISHLGGQGLIAYALAHLPAGFSSVALLLQPVVAAVLAWVLLGEPLGAMQMVGGTIILCGILLAGVGRTGGSPRDRFASEERIEHGQSSRVPG